MSGKLSTFFSSLKFLKKCMMSNLREDLDLVSNCYSFLFLSVVKGVLSMLVLFPYVFKFYAYSMAILSKLNLDLICISLREDFGAWILTFSGELLFTWFWRS